MRILKASVTAVAAALLVMARPASADTFFIANLLTSEEPLVMGLPVTPTTDAGLPRPSFGTAIFRLNDAMTELTMSATIFNIDVNGLQSPDINDNLRAAHIHASAALTNPATRPVVWGFFGAPDNDTIDPQLVVTPFASGLGGVFTSTWNLTEGNGGTTLTAQLPNLLAGRSYLNFHTEQFTGGEIRGTLFPVAEIPEPGTMALLCGAGLPLLGLARRRR